MGIRTEQCKICYLKFKLAIEPTDFFYGEWELINKIYRLLVFQYKRSSSTIIYSFQVNSYGSG